MLKPEDIELTEETKKFIQEVIDNGFINEPELNELTSRALNKKTPTPEELYLIWYYNRKEITTDKLPSMLRNYRLQKEYSLKTVSKLANISIYILRKIESGNLDLPVDIIFGLLEFYDNLFFCKYKLIP